MRRTGLGLVVLVMTRWFWWTSSSGCCFLLLLCCWTQRIPRDSGILLVQAQSVGQAVVHEESEDSSGILDLDDSNMLDHQHVLENKDDSSKKVNSKRGQQGKDVTAEGATTTTSTVSATVGSDNKYDTEASELPINDTSMSNKNTTGSPTTSSTSSSEQQSTPQQSGPWIDLLGPQLLSLEMLDATHAQLKPHYTNEVLIGKQTIGLYFSADWCGHCRKFTPDLVSFARKMNKRSGHLNDFVIVWISRCRDMESYGQYFAHMMDFYALPPDQAFGERGTYLSQKYHVKGIPAFVLLDDVGNLITHDGRTKLAQDKAGIGFPWRNPLVTLYMNVFPRSLRFMIQSHIVQFNEKLLLQLKRILLVLRRPQSQQKSQVNEKSL